jgi:signal transduction histidine kinase
MIAAWRALPALLQDAVLAAVATLTTMGVPLLDATVSGMNGLTFLWGLLVLAVCAPLAVRRYVPLTAALASAVAVVLAIILHQPQVGAWVTVAAFASAAYHRDRGRLMPAIAAICWLVALDLMLGGVPPHPSRLVMSVAAGLAPVAFGYALRLNHDRARQLTLLERADERTRIAREVHDVVGHHLSAIRLQAVGAQRGTAADAGHALEAIAEISATALGETRRLLGLLRDEDGGTDLGSLAARLSRQGLRVRLHGDALTEDVPPQVRYGVYRIVQESLTNVIRHSGVSQAVVRVGRNPGGVVVVVEDGGRAFPGDPAVAEGSGIRGMRERAAQLGGTLTAGPRTPHGWRMNARIPLRTREAGVDSDASGSRTVAGHLTSEVAGGRDAEQARR